MRCHTQTMKGISMNKHPRADLSRRALLASAGAAVAVPPAIALAAESAPAGLGTASGGAGPDAKLIALAAEWLKNDAESCALSDAYDRIPEPPHVAQLQADLVARSSDLQAEIASTPAHTMAGLQAKARVVWTVAPLRPDNITLILDHDEAVAASLARDLLALPGGVA